MKNKQTRTILYDLKAAVRIGHIDTIQAGLDSLRSLPNVAANLTMQTGFIEQVILPIGQLLANHRINGALLRSLATEPLAAMRAVAAVGQAFRFLDGDRRTCDLLNRLASDPRSDVRLALTISLQNCSSQPTEPLLELTQKWLQSESPRRQEVALGILPSLAQMHLEIVFEYLTPLNTLRDSQARAALVRTLQILAHNGYAEKVIALLERWATQEDTKIWILTRALSGSWATAYAPQALSILRQITLLKGPKRKTIQTLKALANPIDDSTIHTAMRAWQQEDHPNLVDLARKYFESEA
jgi:hypothetical protein